jgi:hypothetical protein
LVHVVPATVPSFCVTRTPTGTDAPVATGITAPAFHIPSASGRQPLAYKVEDVLDASERVPPMAAWPNPRSLRSGFYVYEDEAASDFVSVCNLPRRGRIAVARSRWRVETVAGEYPVTVTL